MKINCHIIEEHNEALIVWLKYIKEKKISSENNLLLHFDDHSDMSVPKFDSSINNILNNSTEDIIEFVMKNVTIETFIIAACFLNIIDNINWIQIDGVTSSQEQYVTSYLDDGKNIISGYLYSEDNAMLKNNVVHRYFFNKFSPNTFNNNQNDFSNYFLDIDLDYFSCEVNPNLANEVVIEITKDEFDSFNSNYYHTIRYLVNRVETMIQDEKYYMVINYYHDVIPSPRKVDNEQILERIADLKKLLQSIDNLPQIITICKSVNSGYLPEDQCDFVLKNVLKMINEIYDVKVHEGY